MPRTLAQNAEYIANTIKPAIKSAIEAQGVTVPSTDSFLDYADRIAEIEGGGSGYQLKDLPSGSISTVTDAAELPLNALKVSVEAWQEGSGNPSPSNIRPIHGWDSGVINNKSRNLLTDKNDYVLTVNTGEDAAINITTYNVISGKTYTVSCYQNNYIDTSVRNTLQVSANGGTLYEDGALTNNYHQNSGVHKITFTANSDHTIYVRFWGHTLSTQSTYSQWQIEESPDFTMYQPYWTPIITALNFPQTIYGAEWDVVGGVIVNQYNCATFSFSLPTTTDSNNRWELGKIVTDILPEMIGTMNRATTDYYSIADRLEKKLENLAQEGEATYSLYGHSTWVEYRIRIPNTYTAEEAQTIANASALYYPCNPTTIPLSPLSIRLLEGTNNLYADCGEVIEGEYFVDEGAHRYQLYDYIESDGTQVIDLGFAPENGATVTTSFILLSTQTSEAFVYGATDNSAWLGFAQNPASRNTIYENNTSGRSEAYIKDQQYLLTLTASRDYTNHLCMFGFYLNGYAPGIKTRLCYCKYNDNFYLPAKRKSDGVFGLWDVANQTFLTDSAGGNAFVGGNPTGVEV